MTIEETEPAYTVPSCLQDLERAPYNLSPYPDYFDNGTSDSRIESFKQLLQNVSEGNDLLGSRGSAVFYSSDGEAWLDEKRMQDLYTLVRKGTTISTKLRQELYSVICRCLKTLMLILDQVDETVPQSFRDALAFHLYMLYSLMFLVESEQQHGGKTAGNKDKSNNSSNTTASNHSYHCRSLAVQTLLYTVTEMARNRNLLWNRGVVTEAVVLLPCRISYVLLEHSTGVIARKNMCGDEALQIIQTTVTSYDALLTSVSVTLMDLMHSFEHMAPIVAELVSITNVKANDDSNSFQNKLGIELIKETGRISGDNDDKSSGTKYVSPFFSELSRLQPTLVLPNLSHWLPHFNTESYNIRCGMVGAVSYLLVHLHPLVLAKSDENNEEQVDKDEDAEDRSAYAIGTDVRKTQNSLLDLLMERIFDVSSFTRSAVLKAWIRLVQSNAIPLDRVHSLAKLAVDRLTDKTVLVRKQAMQLLTTLLEHNPFMGVLNPDPYREKLTELYAEVRASVPHHIVEPYKVPLDEAKEADDESALNQIEAAILQDIFKLTIEPQLSDDIDEQFLQKVKALQFTQQTIDFIDIIESAVPSLHCMLLSTNNSDVTEALRFIVQARNFQLPCAVAGMKKALALMWSSEQVVREEVIKTFIEMFLARPGSGGENLLPNEAIVSNLIQLTTTATPSELASIEEAIRQLIKSESIPVEVFALLFSILGGDLSSDRTCAMQLIAMAAAADHSLIDNKSRLKTILDTALGDNAQERREWQLISAAAAAIQTVDRAKVDPSDAKYLVIELIIEELSAVARGDCCYDQSVNDSMQWLSAADQAIKALFSISPEPEVACNKVLLAMYASTLNSKDGVVHPLRLARVFHVLGEIALNLIVYTENVCGMLRRANAAKALKLQEESSQRKSTKSDETSIKDADAALEEELGMAAEAEADNDRLMTQILEEEILGRGTMSHFIPLLLQVVANADKQFNCELLRQTSTLALCKCMCVSSTFCEKNLPLLLQSLSGLRLQDTTTRSNIIVALGDLAFRFPNEVEPFTPRLYACLRDSSTKVKRHTLMVLSHLILNDMIKVKGQVCEIALCLRDEDHRIRDMSRFLFQELSKRSNNPVYNLLPDIISQLVQLPDRRADFRSIMSFLLGFITKERQNEVLTEKLCLRFPKCDSMPQKADLAFCIGQLKITEKSLKLLTEHYKLYKDCLYDEDVSKTFATIIAKSKKQFSKPETKQLIEEWESKINTAIQAGSENQSAQMEATTARSKSQKSARTKLAEINEDEEEDSELDLEGSDEEMDEADKENFVQQRRSSRTLSTGCRQST